MLRLENVTHTIARGLYTLPLVRDATMSLNAGQVGVICDEDGQSAATLLRIAAGLQEPDSGRVVLTGDEITAPGPRRRAARRRRQQLRRRVAWATRAEPQTPELSVLDLVAMAQHQLGLQAAHACAWNALQRTGVDRCAHARWHELSPAQQTRVAIARAIALEPELIVSIDPLGSLGVGEREATAALLQRLTREERCGILYSATSISGLGAHLDRLWMMEGGRLLPVPTEQQADRPDAAGGTVIHFRRAEGHS